MATGVQLPLFPDLRIGPDSLEGQQAIPNTRPDRLCPGSGTTGTTTARSNQRTCQWCGHQNLRPIGHIILHSPKADQ